MLTEFYKQEHVPLEKAFGKEYPSYFLDPDAEYNALMAAAAVITPEVRVVVYHYPYDP